MTTNAEQTVQDSCLTLAVMYSFNGNARYSILIISHY